MASDPGDFFWLANNSGQPRQCVVHVRHVAGAASVWDCETGSIRPVASEPDDKGSRIQLTFRPHEAYWLAFDGEQPARSDPIMELPREKTVLEVVGAWNVRIDPAGQPNLEHEVGIPPSFAGPAGVAQDLTPWSTWTDLPGTFSGLIDYTKTIDVPAVDGPLVLDLGTVYHFAEVWVNGEQIGVKLWPPFEFPAQALRPGKNKVRIRVGNLVNNNYGIDSPSGMLGPVIVKERVEP